MSRKKRMQNLREAKDRRMKKIAIAGGVVLLAVLAFELSHMLGGGSKSSASAPAATTTDTGASTTTTPTSVQPTTAPGTAAAAVMPTSGTTKLPNSDVAPVRSKSELYSFTHFAGKDPFVQQVATNTQASTSPTSSSSSTPTATAPQTAPQAAKVNSRTPRARTLAKTGAATISINGQLETVRLGASFPSSNPLFRLVSVSHGVARIGIANGSYASGAQTVSLVPGRTLTLVDTADGIRYKLRLLAAA